MKFTLHSAPVYCDSGGADHAGSGPHAVFIHGALNDHSVWTAPARHFAAHGYRVLAPDLPGHGRSLGAPLTSIEAMAAWLLALLDAAGIERTLLAGHSMGALIALEAARQAPARVTSLALLGVAWPMQVADALLDSALRDQDAAIEMVAKWSHAPGSAAQPAARALMQRLAGLSPVPLLHTDLAACNAYAGGESAAQALDCPAMVLIGRHDKMTPARAAHILTGALRHASIAELDAGHQMMAERPDEVCAALLAFATNTR